MSIPLLPYAGTSGWSGSETSRERAETEDSDGTTTRRQSAVIRFLAEKGALGATWKDVATTLHWHHGQASGALSVLHKEGKIVRLVDRRNRCAVYVLPQHQMDRKSSPHGRKVSAAPERAILIDLIAEMREVADWNHPSASSRALTRRLDRAEARLREVTGDE